MKRQSLATYFVRQNRQILPILLLILVNLVIGLLTFQDYGASWDEPGNIAYGEHSLQNYVNLFTGQPVVDYNREHLDQKGPVFFILVVLAERVSQFFFPTALNVNTWHFVYFLSFQAGVLALYFLIRRWASPWAAFGGALLFSTQPLLWGHAFMNPKDVPFMAFFLISATAGLYLLDGLLGDSGAEEQFAPTLRLLGSGCLAEWRTLSARKKTKSLILAGALFASALLVIAGDGFIRQLLADFAAQAYSADQHSFLGGLFHRFAQSSGNMPVAYYIEKVQSLWGTVQPLIILLLAILLIAVLINAFATLNAETRRFWKIFLSALRDGRLLAAAIVLGLTVSIRILGPLVGVIVALYALEKSFRRAFPVVSAYALVAMFSAFLTWPYLWRSPLGQFMEVIRLMSKYTWSEQVLFNGTFYAPNQLPWHYLPTLISIQLTEPLLLLIVGGLLVVIFRFRRYRHLDFAGLAIWFLLPLIGPVLSGSTVYDNFRQFFFILPPLFVFAALGLDALFSKLNSPWLKAGLLVLLALPGIYSSAKLHPYEYVYYNRLVGGTGNAFRRFEMDYWGTSYKAAAEFLNENAAPNASVIVTGPDELFRIYARPDLKVIPPDDAIAFGGKYDYFVSLTRWDKDLKSCAEAPNSVEISRDGAIFAVVRQLTGNEGNCP